MTNLDLYDWLYGIAVVSLLSSFACLCLYWVVKCVEDDDEDDHPTHI